MCEEEVRVVHMRPVEKVAPTSCEPVGGTVSCVLGLDAVVLGSFGVWRWWSVIWCCGQVCVCW